MKQRVVAGGRCVTAIIGVGLAVLAPLAHGQTCDADPEMANLDFVLEDMNGQDVRLSDYLGQVILLDFWATWCAPCRIEMPGFVELYEEYGSRGFVVLGISVDDSASDIRSFAAELSIVYPLLVGADRDDVKNAYGPPIGYPTAFIIGRDGRTCTSHTGFVPKEQFEEEILPLL